MPPDSTKMTLLPVGCLPFLAAEGPLCFARFLGASSSSLSSSAKSEGGRSSRATPAAANYRNRTAKVILSVTWTGVHGVAGPGWAWLKALMGRHREQGQLDMVREGAGSDFARTISLFCLLVQQAKPPKQQGAGDAEEEEEEE